MLSRSLGFRRAIFIWRAVKWKPKTRYKVTMEFVLSKVIARSVNTFIPLGDEKISSSLVEGDRSLMDPQSHRVLHFLVRMKQTSTNVFLQVAQNAEVTRRNILAVRRMLKCFPANSLKLIPHQIGSKRTGNIMQKDDSVRHYFRAFWLLWHITASSTTKKRTTSLCSSLLASISNAGRAHFTLLSPPEQ